MSLSSWRYMWYSFVRNNQSLFLEIECRWDIAKCLKSCTASNKAPEPPPDGLCCGSGCQNCCWLVYAEELLDFYKEDGKDKAFQALKNIPDLSAREFVKMELKMKIQLKKK